jgi:hypothetical protein
MDTTQSSPTGIRMGREDRKQSLLLAAQRHVNPDTGRLPADQVKGVYAELAREFGLEPSSVSTYLPSSIKPTAGETLAYARSRRSAKAAERREVLVAAPAPVVAPRAPSEVARPEPPQVLGFEGAGVAPAALAEALDAFAARLTAGKDAEIAQVREQVAALQAENQRLMAEVYRLERRLGQVQEALSNRNGPLKSVKRPFALREG